METCRECEEAYGPHHTRLSCAMCGACDYRVEEAPHCWNCGH